MKSSTYPNRRKILRWSTGAAAAAACVPLNVLAQGEPWIFGQTASLAVNGLNSGPFVDLNNGIQAAFAEVNAKGGVNGRPLRLVSLDDGGLPERARANASQLLDREKVHAFFACGGTTSVIGMLPVVEATHTPLISPATGSDTLRGYNPLVIHTRAGYRSEIFRIAQQMSTVGYPRCAVVHSDDPFGKAARAAFEVAAAQFKIPQWKAFVVNTVPEVPQAVDELVRWAPSAILAVPLGGTGIPYFKLLQQKMAASRFTLSLFGNRQALEQLGEASKGLIVSQVMPNPFNPAIPVVKAYQAALRKANAGEPNYASLEGYVASRILAEALRRGGKALTPDRIVSMYLTMRTFDVGGYEVAYGATNHAGSNFVDLAFFDGTRFRR